MEHRRWAVVAALAAVVVTVLVLWAPADRASVLVSLVSVVVTGVIGWKNIPPRHRR